VFVEPIPQLYAKLEQSVQRWPNATAVNVALSPDSSVAETKAQMWCYGAAFNSKRLGKDLPRWANQICSFNASHIGRHFKGQHGVAVEVTAVSLQELMSRSNVSDVQVQQSGRTSLAVLFVVFKAAAVAYCQWHPHSSNAMQTAAAVSHELSSNAHAAAA
jgi:hypothetical protein